MSSLDDQRARAQKSIYTRLVLFSLASAVVAYVNSTYLYKAGLAQNHIDWIYALEALTGIAGLWLLVFKRYSIASYSKILIGLTTLQAATLILLANSLSHTTISVSMFLLLASASPMFFIFDELLEHVTPHATTSFVRAKYLAIQNICWIVGPLVGFILVEHLANITIPYWIAGIISILFVGYTVYSSSHIRQEQEISITQNKPFNYTVIPIIYSQFSLQLFYACVVTILPVHMHENLHWSWTTIGICIAIALLAFPLVQLPLGRILDKQHLQKIIAPFAMIIIGLSLFAFISQQHSLIIALPIITFFCTRIGAAALEVSNESYLFKHIDTSHRSTIALFRSLAPLSYFCVPLLWYLANTFGIELLLIGVGTFMIMSAPILIVLFKAHKHIHR